MKIKIFELGQIGTNAYLILPVGGDKAILVDAPQDAADTIPAALARHNRKLAAILLTHGHWDHFWDAAKLAELTGAKIYADEEGSDLIENPDFQSRNLFAGAGLKAAKIDVSPKDGETLDIAGLKIKCLYAPGHCPGSMMYYVKNSSGSGALFSGDVIFSESVGRTDLWGGSFADLRKSILEKVYTLPEETKILPGHGPATSVGHEMRNNPYVSAK